MHTLAHLRPKLKSLPNDVRRSCWVPFLSPRCLSCSSSLTPRSSLLVPRPLGARSPLLCIIIIIVIIYGPVCFPSAYTITSNFCYLLGQRQQEQQQQRLWDLLWFAAAAVARRKTPACRIQCCLVVAYLCCTLMTFSAVKDGRRGPGDQGKEDLVATIAAEGGSQIWRDVEAIGKLHRTFIIIYKVSLERKREREKEQKRDWEMPKEKRILILRFINWF